MLAEYRAFSRGRLEIEFADPGDDPATEQRLRALGIPKVQLEVLERDQFQLTSVYLGLALLHGGRQEVIPVIQDSGNLEYELTAALLRLTSPGKKAVGWLGAPEADPGGRGGDPLRRELARLYDLQEIAPAAELTKVPDDVETLVVAGPRSLPETARYALDQFIMRGGPRGLPRRSLRDSRGDPGGRSRRIGRPRPARALRRQGRRAMSSANRV